LDFETLNKRENKKKKKKENRTQMERENVWIIQLCAHKPA